MATKIVKKRNWGMILYPESAPVDWMEQLKLSGLKCAISPLHDMDVWSLEDEQQNANHKAGTVKKVHYHVILSYEGPTTFSNVKSLTDRLNQPHPQPLEQVKGMYSYLTHENSPEKFQYDRKDIQTLNGFDIREFVELSKSDVIRIMKEVQVLIRDNNLTEYADLMDLLLDAGDSMADHYEVASNHTLFFAKYLTSVWRRSLGRAVQDEEMKS